MGKLMILSPYPIAAIAASRGTGVANLLSPDPKEVWGDTTYGTAVQIDIDLGVHRVVDTVFLGAVAANAGATWSITGGADYTERTLMAEAPLRAADARGAEWAIAHAFWNGGRGSARYLRLNLKQTITNPLSAGVVLVGDAFTARFSHEWGAGRKVIDTGTATPLASGGYAIAEGVRKGSFSWTFGDLSEAETDALYTLQRDRGQTRPILVAEDPDDRPGLRWRLHYGLLTNLRAFERRNSVQTRWEMTVEEWV